MAHDLLDDSVRRKIEVLKKSLAVSDNEVRRLIDLIAEDEALKEANRE